MTPKISLLMLGYNGVAYIKAAIDSVKYQTYPNWELIFVDDCSYDGSWELATKLAENEPRIKVYRNETNLGIVKNRKKAYELSTGDLIGHLDNDDALERWALEEMVLAFYREKDVMLIYSDIIQIGEKGEFQLYSASANFDKDNLAQHGWRHFGVYKRSVMKHISGYNDKLISACEDGDLFMQIAEKFRIVRLPKPLYYYRARQDNASFNNKKCIDCSEKPVCNFIKVWAKSAKVNPLTLQKE